ncbi:MAG: helix-turn-helix transcriptional regulator [Labilithrix sp.]|nr:helix-turn-helix transcriptional regulator [Labilithrix sp.]
MRRLPTEPPPSLDAYELEPGKVLFVQTLAVPEVDGLSPAEREVLRLMLNDHDGASIAASRRTSPRTIANQIASVFRKLGVRSRAELAAKLLERPRDGDAAPRHGPVA